MTSTDDKRFQKGIMILYCLVVILLLHMNSIIFLSRDLLMHLFVKFTNIIKILYSNKTVNFECPWQQRSMVVVINVALSSSAFKTLHRMLQENK